MCDTSITSFQEGTISLRGASRIKGSNFYMTRVALFLLSPPWGLCQRGGFTCLVLFQRSRVLRRRLFFKQCLLRLPIINSCFNFFLIYRPMTFTIDRYFRHLYVRLLMISQLCVVSNIYSFSTGRAPTANQINRSVRIITYHSRYNMASWVPINHLVKRPYASVHFLRSVLRMTLIHVLSKVRLICICRNVTIRDRLHVPTLTRVSTIYMRLPRFKERSIRTVDQFTTSLITSR